MKKNVLLVALLLIASSFSMESMAQKNLLDVVKKCEASDSETVSMNIIRNRNSEKKVTNMVITIKISGNKELVNDFLEAAKKDEPDAVNSISKKVGKTTYPSHYEFDKGISFVFFVNDDKGDVNDGYLKVTVIGKDGADFD
ncbi:hypothetical protein FACS189421_09690 [Bacteroidia bacterium]|nr:hypothetical protein FACS189421_09690 [Bacteroidia bacterium]